MTEIRLAIRADLPSVASLFGRAFIDDVMLRWPLPPETTVEDLTALFAILLDVYWPLDAISVIGGEAAVVWLPPEEAARFAEIEGPTREAIRPLTDDGGARYDAFWDWLEEHLPDEPCWFLDILAVDADARGRGLGGRLIEHGLIRAHADGLPAFLETSLRDNVALYARFGFRVIDELAAPDGGPTIWFLRSDPASRA